MPHHLFILRHAQTHDSQYYNSDKERELKPAGIKEATMLGKYLNESNHTVDLIISSDATRAHSTATLLASEIKYPIHQIQYSEKIYSGSLSDLLIMIGQTSDSMKTILLVGHYPTIVELNNYLADTQKTSMQPCELTVLAFTSGWSELSMRCGICMLTYLPSC